MALNDSKGSEKADSLNTAASYVTPVCLMTPPTDELYGYLLEPPVKIIVGEDFAQETFYVHPSLLCEKSEYFRACLQSQFSEAQSREVRLVDEKPSVFRFFLKWLYTGDLAPFPAAKIVVRDGNINVHDRSTVHILRIALRTYILGDRLLCSGVKDRAMDILQQCCERWILHPSDALEVVNAGLGSSIIGRYHVKQLARQIQLIGWNHYTKEKEWLYLMTLDANFVTEIILEVDRLKAQKVAEVGNMAAVQSCAWHEHGKGSGCKGIRWESSTFRTG